MGADIAVKVNGRSRKADVKKCGGVLCVTVSIAPTDAVEITLSDADYLKNRDKKQELTETIAKYQMANDYKGMMFTEFLKTEKPLPPLAETYTGPIKEILRLYRG